MKFLLCGYGNIGKALASIIRHLNEAVDWIIVDTGNGSECLEYIRANHAAIDAVINLTGQMTLPIVAECARFDLDYIDSALEYPSDRTNPEILQRQIIGIPSRSRRILGFGMNPGLVEYMYQQYKPAGRHVACIFEHDTATCGDKIFNTWSVESYYEELVRTPLFISTPENPHLHVEDWTSDQYGVELMVEGQRRNYRMIPHEETMYIVQNEKNCLACAFLYQAPIGIHRYFCELLKDGGALNAEIPVLYDVEGADNVGVLFYDFQRAPYYVYNSAPHKRAFAQYGTNGTCWQTASGVYCAMHLLPHLKKGETLNATQLSMRYGGEIGRMLNRLGLDISVQENYVDRQEFERLVLPLFKRSFE